MSTLQERLQQDIKEAMRAQDKARREALRLIAAAMKQIEVDERIVIDDARALQIFDKLAKQRKESIAQFQNANRHDLVEKEQYELDLIQTYLPPPLSEAEVDSLIKDAIQSTGATSMSAMGSVMNHLRPTLQGRCDMSKVSARIKALLT